MPTEKKRVNLSLPDSIYERIQAYKTKNGITSDAGACLQLITRQLDGLEKTEEMIQLVQRFSFEELQQISNMGLTALKEAVDEKKDKT